MSHYSEKQQAELRAPHYSKPKSVGLALTVAGAALAVALTMLMFAFA